MKQLNFVPNHIGIIPEGNRRWAKKRGLVGVQGHKKAGEFDSLISLFEEARRLGVKYVSFWGFSTDNWKRGREEIDNLFEIFLKGIKRFGEYAEENKVRFRHFGRKDRFPKKVVDALNKLEEDTKKYSEYNIQLCLDYGGRDEIVRAVNKAVDSGEKVDEESFKEYLDSVGVPDPDLIIRTSGEKRISGFMPFQAVYSELYFVKKHFPSFKPKDVREAIMEFSRRKRRFGGN